MLEKIMSGIFALLLSVAGWFGNVPVRQEPIIYENLGAQNAVGGEIYYLSGSGVSATQSTINLTKFGYTKPDKTYQKFSMANFGDLGCGTFQPGDNGGKQEFVSFTGITQNSDGTAQLAGASRGLERFPPYTASTTLQTAHAGGTKFVVSNSPPCFYESYANVTASSTIKNRWIFETYPEYVNTTAATTSKQFATKGYADLLANQGAATSSETIAGISEQATQQEMASSTSFGANDPHVINSEYATSSPYIHSGGPGNFAAVTETDLYLNQGFLDLSENFGFTGNLTRGTSSPAASFAQQGNAFISGTTTTGGLAATSSASVGGNLTVTKDLTVSGTCSGCSNSVTSYIPQAVGTASTSQDQINSASSALTYAYQFQIPFTQTFNKISFAVAGVGTAAGMDIKIFSENGQTVTLGTTTSANISAGLNTMTASSSFTLNPGIYYLAFRPHPPGNGFFYEWDYNNSSVKTLIDPTGEPRTACQFSVVAGNSALVGTFDPTLCTAGDRGLLVRFDN